MNLNNRSERELLYNNDKLCCKFIEIYEQKHPLQRKIQFFLDIRGILKVNNLVGSYVEYGCYRCETMYMSAKILEEKCIINRYIGIDIFNSTNLKLTENDKNNNSFDRKNPFITENPEKLIDIFDGFKNSYKFSLVKGDIRDESIMNNKNLSNLKISIAVIDTNFISSLESSIDNALDNIINGGFIFIDDYFTNLENGVPVIHNYFNKALKKRNILAIDFKTYAPFAKAFILFKKE